MSAPSSRFAMVTHYPRYKVTIMASAKDVEFSSPLESPRCEPMGKNNDDQDMARLGRSQELIRQFKSIALTGFTIRLAATWPYAIVSTPLSLLNGGPAGAIWMLLAVCFGQSTVVLSLAHAASMAPASGGPYHWVSEFAPRRSQQLLSYFVGWLDIIGWQAGTAGTAYFVGSLFLALIALCNPTFVIESWHITVACIIATAVAIPANTFVKALHWLEGLLFIFQIFGFVAVVIVLLVLGPRTDLRETFFDFQDNAGWGSPGLATLVGVLSPFIILAGADSTCHLAEETRDASRKVPRVMIWSMLFSYPAALAMTCVIMVVSTGYDEAVAAQTGQAGIAIILNATQSMTTTIVITIALCIILFFGLVNQITIASRVTWAFGRDKGLPYHEKLATISPYYGAPLYALATTPSITAILCLFPLASTISLNIITSLSLIGLLCAYFITILTVLDKRVRRKEPFPDAHLPLSDGVATAINVAALCFLSLVIVLMFFPAQPHPTGAEMNWTVVLLPGIMLLAGAYYWARASKVYEGPIVLVRKTGRDDVVLAEGFGG